MNKNGTTKPMLAKANRHKKRIRSDLFYESQQPHNNGTYHLHIRVSKEQKHTLLQLFKSHPFVGVVVKGNNLCVSFTQPKDDYHWLAKAYR